MNAHWLDHTLALTVGRGTMSGRGMGDPEERMDNKASRGTPVAPEAQVRSRRPRRRSWLTLGLLGTLLTFVGLAAGTGSLPRIELFPSIQGLSLADMQQLDEVKKLG